MDIKERYCFILIVEINTESFRACNEETSKKNITFYFLPVFLVALLASPSKEQDREYTIDLTGQYFYQIFEKTQHVASVDLIP